MTIVIYGTIVHGVMRYNLCLKHKKNKKTRNTELGKKKKENQHFLKKKKSVEIRRKIKKIE